MPEVLQQFSEGKRRKTLTNVRWREVLEKKAYRGRIWRMMGKEPCVRGMWEYFLQERNRVKRFREQAEEEKQAGIQGQWQMESPAREYLEQVKCCHDTDCTKSMMKEGFTALKGGDWEEYDNTFRKEVKATEWAFDRIKEAFEQAAQDDARKMSIVQEIMIRSTDYLRRIIAPEGGQGGVPMSHLCPHCNSLLGRLHLVGLREEKAHKLVVCDMWREIRLEATEQAFGRTTR